MNGRAHKQAGLTLVEMTLVVATIALLVGFGLPAVRSLIHSFESQSGTRSMISAALSSARAIAVKHQRYAGVRFQKKCISKDPASPLDRIVEAPQYMVFIIHEEPRKMGDLTVGFRAVEGLEPVKLADTIGVIDVSKITDDDEIDEDVELNDATAFSIIFSPAGKLVVHDVRTRNRHGVHKPVSAADDPDAADTSLDDIFNSVVNVTAADADAVGVFIQDDYPDWGLDKEASRTSFMIYEHQRLRSAFAAKTAWSEYLSLLPDEAEVFVSPYTGALISSEWDKP
jgi:type II secretory pathway pseudopilin PulG